MRNPNGVGSPVKLSGNRRNPYGARITIGFKENGHPIYKFIGFYPTKKEAQAALWARYNNGGEIADNKTITLYEVFEEWKKEHAPTMKSFNQYEVSLRAFEPLYNKPIEKLVIRDYEEVGCKSGRSANVLKVARIALGNMYAYAYRKGYINESKATLPKFIQFNGVTTSEYEKHKAFTKEEVKKLWENQNDEIVQIILFMIYSGVRITELAALKKEDVHIDKGYFEIKESKTEAGVRKVPIADKVLFIAEHWESMNREYFAPIVKKAKLSNAVNCFRQSKFIPTCERVLNVYHIPHDTRYSTATFLTEKQADIRHIKLILGHAQQDVTNDVYAKKIDIESLRETINLIS